MNKFMLKVGYFKSIDPGGAEMKAWSYLCAHCRLYVIIMLTL